MKKSLLFILVVFAVTNVYITASAYIPPDREPPIRTQGGGTRNTRK